MSTPARKRATYEDLLAVPDRFVAQIIDGELIVQPRPATPHARATTRLGAALDAFDGDDEGGGRGGWLILDEPELHLGKNILVPDLAGWRRTRMPTLPSAPFLELPPDWICEVLSPSTARLDRKEKLALYAHAGVPHAWLIDPEPRAQTLEVLRLDPDGHYKILAVHAGDAAVRAEPFEAMELKLARLWT